MLVHPLIFDPIYKPRIWGGERIRTYWGRAQAGSGQEAIGESWELSDFEGSESVVSVGPARGRALHALMVEWEDSLMGRVAPADGRFPLLIKYLDAREALSVQVHPSEAVARKIGGSTKVKHEAWYVLEASPGAFIYHGLIPGVSADAFNSAMLEGRPDDVLRRVPVRPGDCYYLPSGTPHALTAGILVAEIQTTSDTTYRAYDYGRIDAITKQPRELHLEQAIQCIDFDSPSPPPTQERTHVASLWTAVTRLAACPFFMIERVRMVEGIEQQIPYAEPVIWVVLEGSGEIHWRSGARPISFRRGDVVLLPALMQEPRVRIQSATQWLEVTMPVRSNLADYERPPVEEAMSPTSKIVQIKPLKRN